jgi:hypothetical protein
MAARTLRDTLVMREKFKKSGEIRKPAPSETKKAQVSDFLDSENRSLWSRDRSSGWSPALAAQRERAETAVS